jgi:addiction module HigA family antidote
LILAQYHHSKCYDIVFSTALPGRVAKDIKISFKESRANGCHYHPLMSKLLNEIHPGEILLEDFMRPMGMNALQLASGMDVSSSCINELVIGARPITPDIAMRLGSFFSMETLFWLTLQKEFDQRLVKNLQN